MNQPHQPQEEVAGKRRLSSRYETFFTREGIRLDIEINEQQSSLKPFKQQSEIRQPEGYFTDPSIFLG